MAISLALAPLALSQMMGVSTLAATAEEEAQAEATGEEGAEESVLKTWTGTFGDDTMNGVITLRLAHLVSVSIHNYMLNGTAPVSELTIDTKGNCTIRIYSHIPLTELASATKQEAFNAKNTAKSQGGSTAYYADEAAGKFPLVTKQYPLTTHSHNIEYTLGDYRQLELIYNSIVSAMTSGEETTYTINN